MFTINRENTLASFLLWKLRKPQSHSVHFNTDSSNSSTCLLTSHRGWPYCYSRYIRGVIGQACLIWRHSLSCFQSVKKGVEHVWICSCIGRPTYSCHTYEYGYSGQLSASHNMVPSSISQRMASSASTSAFCQKAPLSSVAIFCFSCNRHQGVVRIVEQLILHWNFWYCGTYVQISGKWLWIHKTGAT